MSPFCCKKKKKTEPFPFLDVLIIFSVNKMPRCLGPQLPDAHGKHDGHLIQPQIFQNALVCRSESVRTPCSGLKCPTYNKDYSDIQIHTDIKIIQIQLNLNQKHDSISKVHLFMSKV